MDDKETWDIATEDKRIADSMNNERAVLRIAAPMSKPRDFDPHPKLWHLCCLVTVDFGTCA